MKFLWAVIFIAVAMVFYIITKLIEKDSNIVCKEILTITETGQCTFDKYGAGSCAVMLDDGTSARLQTVSVVGEKIIKCYRQNGNIFYRRPQ